VAAAQTLMRALLSRWGLNAALALMVAALAALALFGPGATPDKPAPLTTLAPENINTVRIEQVGRPAIVLQRSDTGWQLTAPRAARASEFRAEALVRLASAPRHATLPPASALKDFGLEPPLASVTLNAVTIRFGALHPIDSRQYVAVGDEIALIPAILFREVTGRAEDWLATSPLAKDEKPVAFQFPGFRLHQDAQGAWRRTPEDKMLTTDTLNRFVDEWRHARALSVTPGNDRPPLQTIRVTLASDKGATRDVRFAIIARKPALILRRLDEQLDYQFPEDTGQRLLQPTAE
jgi:hypothetical protein